MKRQRFHQNRVCSSDNYALSCKVRKDYITYCHFLYVQNPHYNEDSNINLLDTKTNKYVKVFDKLIPVSNEKIKLYNLKNIIKK